MGAAGGAAPIPAPPGAMPAPRAPPAARAACCMAVAASRHDAAAARPSAVRPRITPASPSTLARVLLTIRSSVWNCCDTLAISAPTLPPSPI